MKYVSILYRSQRLCILYHAIVSDFYKGCYLITVITNEMITIHISNWLTHRGSSAVACWNASCKKPLPRCAICFLRLGTISASQVWCHLAWCSMDCGMLLPSGILIQCMNRWHGVQIEIEICKNHVQMTPTICNNAISRSIRTHSGAKRRAVRRRHLH